MRVTPFDPTRDLIFVEGYVGGPRKGTERLLRLVLIRVTHFACLGHQATDFRVHAHDLPEGWSIDGLIGLSFLRQLNYEIRSVEGRILAEPATP